MILRKGRLYGDRIDGPPLIATNTKVYVGIEQR